HVALLLEETLQAAPLGVSELRRKLPAYAVAQAEVVLHEQINQGKIHRHPRLGKRGKERYGLRSADAKDYLRSELSELFRDLARLGFTEAQLREGAIELLHEEEWSPMTPPAEEPAAGEESQAEANPPASIAATPPEGSGQTGP